MHILSKIYETSSLLLLMVMVWMMYGTRGGLMEKKWEMMKSMWEKEHDHGKSISFHIKPVSIPIPLPVPYAVKAEKAAKPWKAESKEIFWKMMIMKMMKGDKKCKKPCSKSKCCSKMMMMPAMKASGCKKCKKCDKSKKGCDDCNKGCSNSGCSMMPAMKASPMMCCDCSQTMMSMNGCGNGWPMNGGWPMENSDSCCSSDCGGGGGGGWPDEEEEEEEPEDYEDEEPPHPMMGWDTNDVPIYLHPNRDFTNDLIAQQFIPSKKGDNIDELYLTGRFSLLKAFRTKVKGVR